MEVKGAERARKDGRAEWFMQLCSVSIMLTTVSSRRFDSWEVIVGGWGVAGSPRVALKM